MEQPINQKIREIAQSVNETIPVAWDNLFINITLAFDGGEVYYFFNEEGKSEYIYNLYIPKQYGIPNLEFRENERRTFKLAWELREIFKIEYKKGKIYESQDLRMQQTYTFLEKLAENGQFVEIGRVASNGIYDFLFEELGVQKSGENKNTVKNWLDNKKGNFEKELEKEQLSELMKLFLEVKNNSRSITGKEIVKKIRHLQNILTKKSFLEAIENVNLNDKESSQIKQAPKINLNKEDRKILVFKEIFGEQEKSEVIKKYKIKRISKLSSEIAKEWQNLENDSNKEKNIKRFKDIIDRNIDSGDILLIEGEVGITFELVNWAKEKGIIAIYGVEKVTDNFLLKVEFYEY